jgi:hypothetical protein
MCSYAKKKKVFAYGNALQGLTHSFNTNYRGLKSHFHFYFHYKISVDAGPKDTSWTKIFSYTNNNSTNTNRNLRNRHTESRQIFHKRGRSMKRASWAAVRGSYRKYGAGKLRVYTGKIICTKIIRNSGTRPKNVRQASSRPKKSLKNIRLKGIQFNGLPGAPTCLGPALFKRPSFCRTNKFLRVHQVPLQQYSAMNSLLT